MQYFLRANCGPEARSCSIVSGKTGGEKGALERGLPSEKWWDLGRKRWGRISGGRKVLNKGEEAGKSLGVQNSKEAGGEFGVGECIEPQGQGRGLEAWPGKPVGEAVEARLSPR